MSEFHTLVVSEVKQETPNSVSISFEVPAELRPEFQFEAGQYLTIKYFHKDQEIRRAYSICSSPNSDLLKVGVKKVDKGIFSKFANEKLKAGDKLEVMAPKGKFTLVKDQKNYVAFAAGSGITPVLSLIQHSLEDIAESTFLLIYGNQSLVETMFHDKIMEIKEAYPERFFVEFIFSRKLEDNARFGRIDRSIVNFYLKSKYEETDYDAFYICGPEPMIDEISATLKHNGINEKRIYHELFSTSEEGLLVQQHDGNTTIKVTLDGDVDTFKMPQVKSILDAALEEGLDPPYSCQGGICSTCIARIKKGKAEMRKNQILTDAEIAEGLILTCQAHPTTTEIEVDYDDV